MQRTVVLTSSPTADGLSEFVSRIEGKGYDVVRAGTSEELISLELPPSFMLISDRTTFLIPEYIYTKANRGAYNIHPSLLPMHPGSYSLFWSCLFGDPYGISIHELSPHLDKGDILFQLQIPYSEHQTFRDIYHLTRKHTDLAIEIILDADIAGLKFQGIPQPGATSRLHTSRFTKSFIEALPNGWDTEIYNARKALNGRRDEVGRVIGEDNAC